MGRTKKVVEEGVIVDTLTTIIMQEFYVDLEEEVYDSLLQCVESNLMYIVSRLDDMDINKLSDFCSSPQGHEWLEYLKNSKQLLKQAKEHDDKNN